MWSQKLLNGYGRDMPTNKRASGEDSTGQFSEMIFADDGTGLKSFQECFKVLGEEEPMFYEIPDQHLLVARLLETYLDCNNFC